MRTMLSPIASVRSLGLSRCPEGLAVTPDGWLLPWCTRSSLGFPCCYLRLFFSFSFFLPLALVHLLPFSLHSVYHTTSLCHISQGTIHRALPSMESGVIVSPSVTLSLGWRKDKAGQVDKLAREKYVLLCNFTMMTISFQGHEVSSCGFWNRLPFFVLFFFLPLFFKPTANTEA